MKFDEKGLIPAIAQDSVTGEILMVAYMNQESLALTIEYKQAWFYSRSRQELWHKGATSGNYLHVERILTDCDSDVILMLVRPVGPACHTGERSCFFQEVVEAEKSGERPKGSGYLSSGIMERVFDRVLERQRTKPEDSYVADLLAKGVDGVARKLGEEAVETVIAAKNRDRAAIVNEMADLWFHSLVMLAESGVPASEVWAELERRYRG